MKFKLNFGKGGLKGFVIQHAEKGIFGMVLVLVAAFIYSSATQETVEQGESPSSLKGSAAGALLPCRMATLGRRWHRTGKGRSTIIRRGWDCPAAGRRRGLPGTTPWIKDLIPRQQKRLDPEIYAPSKVEAEAGVFAVMMRTAKPDDACQATRMQWNRRRRSPSPNRRRRSGSTAGRCMAI